MVSMLAEMLESGMEGWDQELLLQDWKVSQGEGTMELEELTPHERRRRVIFGK